MATQYQVNGKKLYIKLDGELDHHLAEKVKYQCELILRSYFIKEIIFDFEHSDFMDSSGVGLILGRYQKIHAVGGKVSVMHMNNTIRRVVHMAGLHGVIEEK
ncbi:MAG: anti-sigma factor antagonist [Anaerostipes sp.]|nr:anti-sigma factor antagonist [Anaerostipes sp.]